MNRATARPGAGDLDTVFSRLIDIGPRMAEFSSDLSRRFLREASALVAATGPLVSEIQRFGPRRARRCQIPEVECPEQCACEIRWRARRGEKVRATVKVTNTATVARDFSFVSTPFEEGGQRIADGPTVSPTNARIESGRPLMLVLDLGVDDRFDEDHTYETELLIRGSHEQCVRVLLEVESPRVPHCEVRHGEPPVRVRAHHWYDHYQCVEPCPGTVSKKGG